MGCLEACQVGLESRSPDVRMEGAEPVLRKQCDTGLWSTTVAIISLSPRGLLLNCEPCTLFRALQPHCLHYFRILVMSLVLPWILRDLFLIQGRLGRWLVRHLLPNLSV